MWHEARKQEKKIKGMMVDYKRRAERRRNFYERIKADPTQFMQIHGRPYKIHLDPSIAQAAESPANMMPWLGDKENLIDRFDVRAHLDYIPDIKLLNKENSMKNNPEERQSNYERYRILVQSDLLGIPEDKFLNQIFLEERYGPVNKTSEEEKKKLAEKKAAIGYVYEDSTPNNMPFSSGGPADSDDDNEDDSDIDLDAAVDYDQLTAEQKKEMNNYSLKYGMFNDDFMLYMGKDKEESEALRLARELEEEKAMYSGRKSRRERRAFREKRLQGRKISPPSYAAKESPTHQPYNRSTSRSKSRSPENCGQITFITSFGDEPEPETPIVKPASNSVSNDKQHRKKEIARMKKEYGPQLQRNENSRRSRSRSPRKQARSPRNTDSRRYNSRYSHSYHSRRRSSSRSDESTSRSRSRKDRSRSPYSSRRNISSGSSRYRSRSRERKYSETSRYSRSPKRRRRYDSHQLDSSRYRSNRSSSSEYRSTKNRVRNERSRSKSSDSNSSNSSNHSKSSSSRSSSKSRSKASSQSKSRSLSPRPVRRYRRNSKSLSPKTDSESRSSDDSTDAKKSRKASIPVRNVNKSSDDQGSTTTKGKLTPQERLKKKMQLALNRHYKADKVAEHRKILKQEKMQKDREEELREMSIKLRRKDRERRHSNLQRYRRSSSDSSDSFSDSSRSPSPFRNHR